MAHTVKVISLGFGLLGICLVVGRLVGGPQSTSGMVAGAIVFLPLWLAGAGINMWRGVTKAGYTVREEIPYLLIVFAVPAAVAAVIWWRLSRG